MLACRSPYAPEKSLCDSYLELIAGRASLQASTSMPSHNVVDVAA